MHCASSVAWHYQAVFLEFAGAHTAVPTRHGPKKRDLNKKAREWVSFASRLIITATTATRKFDSPAHTNKQRGMTEAALASAGSSRYENTSNRLAMAARFSACFTYQRHEKGSSSQRTRTRTHICAWAMAG
jgi:hypothetical protein